jgi:hypothetical protein
MTEKEQNKFIQSNQYSSFLLLFDSNYTFNSLELKRDFAEIPITLNIKKLINSTYSHSIHYQHQFQDLHNLNIKYSLRHSHQIPSLLSIHFISIHFNISIIGI